MKKLLLASLFITGSFITSAANANTYIDPVLEQKLVKVCEALKSNSKLRLLKVVKNSRLKYGDIAKDLVCNGQEAIEFALLNGANKTASLLANRASIDLDSYHVKL